MHDSLQLVEPPHPDLPSQQFCVLYGAPGTDVLSQQHCSPRWNQAGLVAADVIRRTLKVPLLNLLVSVLYICRLPLSGPLCEPTEHQSTGLPDNYTCDLFSWDSLVTIILFTTMQLIYIVKRYH